MLLRTCSRCCLRLQMHRDWSGLCHLGSALTYRDIHAHSRHTESLPPGGDPPRLRESNRQGQTAPPRGGAYYSVLLLPAETSDSGWMSSLIAKSSNRPKASSSYSPSTGGPAGRAAARLRRGLLTTTTSSSAGTSVAGAGTFSATASTTGSGVGITKTVPTSELPRQPVPTLPATPGDYADDRAELLRSKLRPTRCPLRILLPQQSPQQERHGAQQQQEYRSADLVADRHFWMHRPPKTHRRNQTRSSRPRRSRRRRGDARPSPMPPDEPA